MAISNFPGEEALDRTHYLPSSNPEMGKLKASAISWAAILAGATTAVALSLILLLLGAGLGLSSVSPWAQKGVTATTFGVSSIVWLAVTQIVAAGMGGYIAGRLRTKWTDVMVDEVYFRDTAHGFLTWSVATLVTAILMVSLIGSILSGGVQAASAVAGIGTSAMIAKGASAVGNDSGDMNETGNNPIAYLMDVLFRKDMNLVGTGVEDTYQVSPSNVPQKSSMPEVTRIFVNAISMGALTAADSSYLSQLVSTHTGLTLQASEKRVNQIYLTMQANIRNAEIAAKDAADQARKASIYATLWMFVTLLMGAFSASLAATWGGRCRDVDHRQTN